LGAHPRSKKAASGDKLLKLADAILSTNPILEAFGNAKTVRNNNSSRFGKMMRLHFDQRGVVAGAFIKTYLLEKTRSVAITDPERNYHVFYQLCAGADAGVKGPTLASLKPADLHMLNQSKCVSISGIDDVKSFKEMASAFDLLSVSSEEQKQLFGLLSGLLVLGNVTFVDEDDKAQITDGKWLDATEALLGVTGMATGLTTKKMTRGGAKRSSVYMIDYTKAQAEMARDALVKSIYVHLFDWVVSKVNAHIAGTERASELPYVGLLDIFGFENFKHNSFEQLCINFANEKLQQFFLTCVFKTEEELHVKEGVPWKDIEFADNQPCIELLEKPPNGLLRLLDSQCKTPNATEETFCKELNRIHGKGGFLAPTRTQRMRDEEGFIVRHFAGDVVYHTSLMIAKATSQQEVPWLDKNNDTLQSEWLESLNNSSVPLMKTMFEEEYTKSQKDKKGGAFRSVAKQFVTDLNALLAELQSTKACFIRCIKPNMELKPKLFSAPMVLDQLRCAGVIEAVRVMQEAYPTRIPYEDIHGRYAPLMGEEIMEETGDEPAAFCEAVAQACEVSPNDYALGLSKLFLKVRRAHVLRRGAVFARRFLPFLPFPSFPSPQKADRASRRH
jgi:myosin heavy subunit